MFRVLHVFLSLVHKNAISWAVGVLARLELPRPLQGWANDVFVRIFGIDRSASAEPISSFRSIEDVFTRRLRPGLRPIQAELVSPADGILAIAANVREGELIQAKGIQYPVADLVLGTAVRSEIESFNKEFSPAWFATVYLAPHNYHRVHLPLSGELQTIRHIPGKLWPVNLPYAINFPRLFACNERLVFDFKRGAGRFWVVMVGAFNVGRMTTPHSPGLVTNVTCGQGAIREFAPGSKRDLAAGDELGVFMLGSTVVLVLDAALAATLRPVERRESSAILMGQPLV